MIRPLNTWDFVRSDTSRSRPDGALESQARAGEIYVTERGKLIATIVPASPLSGQTVHRQPDIYAQFSCAAQAPSRRN